MIETLEEFFSSLLYFMNDENTTLKQKLHSFVSQYIDTISKNPNIPLFILNESKKILLNLKNHLI